MKFRILSTLIYADIFDYPLKKEELWEWLIETGDGKTKKLKDKKTFDADTDFLLAGKKIGQKGDYLFLKGKSSLVETRKRREVWSRKKIKRAEKVAGILRKIPWISLIGLTGALSRNNAKRGDDIDLFFIVEENRLWLARGLAAVILKILGLYRGKDKIADMICPNMFVSENALKMTPKDLFVAHEVLLMKPLFDKNDTHGRFIQANSWVKGFLPNEGGDSGILRNKDIKCKDKRPSNILRSQYLNILEKIARELQLFYMSKRRTTEIATDNLIKFHPQDVRLNVLKKWEEGLMVAKLKLQ